ncbi:MAG: hypothetical protein ABGX83_04920 [Nitrospira sp.]|nr:hypothetical protein [Candidatus Manganitrophaceae bacterium]
MQGQVGIYMEQSPSEETGSKITDEKDLAALWAIGILISLILSLAGYFWNPPRYEARQSTSVDATEARVENSQNKLVTDALNSGQIEYDPSMDKLIKLRFAPIRHTLDLVKLLLFPTVPIIIIVLLVRRSISFAKAKKSKKETNH